VHKPSTKEKMFISLIYTRKIFNANPSLSEIMKTLYKKIYRRVLKKIKTLWCILKKLDPARQPLDILV